MKDKITEEMIVKEIMAMLSYNRAKVFRIRERIPWGRTTSTPGIPDLFGWWSTKHHEPTHIQLAKCGEDCIGLTTIDGCIPFFIEVKRPGGSRRPAQIAWIKEAQEDGVIAFFAEGWADVVREMAGYGIALKGTP
jgi:hypothetical protein